jgi:hypothetical protein
MKISSLVVCDAVKIAWPEDEVAVILRNVENYLPNNIA